MDDPTLLMWHLQKEGRGGDQGDAPGQGCSRWTVQPGLASEWGRGDQSLSHACLPCSNTQTVWVDYTPHFPPGPSSPCKCPYLVAFPSLSFLVCKMARVKGASSGPRLLRRQWDNICKQDMLRRRPETQSPGGADQLGLCGTGEHILVLNAATRKYGPGISRAGLQKNQELPPFSVVVKRTESGARCLGPALTSSVA